MSTLCLIIFVLAGATLINRARGFREWQPSWLPGRPLYYMAVAMGLLVVPLLGWQGSVAVGVAYLLWGAPSWGRWYDVDTLPKNYTGPPSLFERAIEAVSFGEDCVALFLRHMLVTPGVFIIGYVLNQPWPLLLLLSITFAAWAVLAYVLGKLCRPRAPTIMAEYLVGFVWGALVLFMWSTRT